MDEEEGLLDLPVVLDMEGHLVDVGEGGHGCVQL